MILDGSLIRRRREELGYSARTLASALGVTGAVITALERGGNHADLALRVVQRLGQLLGVPPRRLFVDQDPGHGPPATDVATVVALLHLTGVLTPVETVAAALRWDLERTQHAAAAAEAYLPTLGLRLHRLGRKIGLARDVEAADVAVVQRLLRAHLLRDGISLAEARMMRRVLDGDPPKEPSNPERVALATLANAGLIEPAGESGAVHEWRPSEDVRIGLGGGLPRQTSNLRAP